MTNAEQIIRTLEQINRQEEALQTFQVIEIARSAYFAVPFKIATYGDGAARSAEERNEESLKNLRSSTEFERFRREKIDMGTAVDEMLQRHVKRNQRKIYAPPASEGRDIPEFYYDEVGQRIRDQQGLESESYLEKLAILLAYKSFKINIRDLA